MQTSLAALMPASVRNKTIGVSNKYTLTGESAISSDSATGCQYVDKISQSDSLKVQFRGSCTLTASVFAISDIIQLLFLNNQLWADEELQAIEKIEQSSCQEGESVFFAKRT
jgi:predicted exporter